MSANGDEELCQLLMSKSSPHDIQQTKQTDQVYQYPAPGSWLFHVSTTAFHSPSIFFQISIPLEGMIRIPSGVMMGVDAVTTT